MEAKVKDIVALIDALAPFETALSWDNVGLLAGDPEATVTCVLTALDATPGVIEEAKSRGAQLIVTHHPILFSPVRRVCADDLQGRLIVSMLRAGISMIAAHTNWDLARGGSNDALMKAAGFEGAAGEGFLRTVQIESPLAPDALVQALSLRLKTQALFYGDRTRPVRRLACCSGAGGEELLAAAKTGADCYLTGELKHHELLEAMQLGLRVALVGHGPSEEPAADALNQALQSQANALQYPVHVIRSKVNPFV